MTDQRNDLTTSLDRLQYRQELHDVVFHSDIYNLTKPKRLTHLVLHHCKYVTELYRLVMDEYRAEMNANSPHRARINRLSIDGLVICLSMANVCNKSLASMLEERAFEEKPACELLLRHVGMMAKTIEDIDHMGQTNPLGEIMESAALMASCYMSINISNRTDYNAFHLGTMLDELLGRLLQVEAKNIFFDKHLVEINRRLAIYDQRVQLAKLTETELSRKDT